MPVDIKQRRMELGLTLDALGNMVGVSKSTVKKWESGYIKNMRRDKIVALANALKVSPLDILESSLSAPPSSSEKITKSVLCEYKDFVEKTFEISPENVILYQFKNKVICHRLPEDVYQNFINLLSCES